MAEDEVDAGPTPPAPVDFDVEKAIDLLEVVHNTKDLPNLLSLNQAAMAQLAKMAAEVQEEMDENKARYDKAMVEWGAEQRQKAEEKRKAEAKEIADAA